MRALVIAAVVLAAPLAGCLDDAAPVQPTATTDSDGDDGAPSPDTVLPDNRSGTFNAFQETNRTETGIGGLDHDHDYWLGRDRVELFRGRYMLESNPTGDPIVTLPVRGKERVYEGTATVEFLVEKPQRHVCEGVVQLSGPICNDRNGLGAPAGPGVDDPAPPKLRLLYKDAVASEWLDAGELTWGAPTALAVEAQQTDMPHSTASLWVFRVLSTAKQDHTSTFEASATIVRGLDVAKWPGHPDFYADGRSRLIFDGTARTKEVGLEDAATGEQSSFDQQAPNRLISYGTEAVHVWINVTSVKAPPGSSFGEWRLAYHNASGLPQDARPVTPPADPSLPQDLYFVIPVDANGMDTPYATDSRWEFNLQANLLLGDPAVFTLGLFGFVSYEVEYRMVIVATNVPPPEPSATA
ncbi:MAG TPA: hypothetical protein VI997_09220 [Candidatus Thermoplasmatota archaeon]|nr:hypothetical protein [Candidatus Thermoplasmatota archaeon]